MDANRDFLFGVLAVQSGYIDPGRMNDLVGQLAGGPEKRIVDVLRERSLITPQQQEEIESEISRLLNKATAASSPERLKQESLPPESLAPITNVGDLEATIDSGTQQQSDPAEEVTATLGGVRRDAYVSLETVQMSPGTRSRYTLTREHGRGGLGCVWLARDSILNREVALKEVLPGGKGDQSRFKKLVREAQITGQLEHPNIVPVYELSPEEETKPFYTMKFLRGATLTEHIRDYRRKRQTGEAGYLELRKLLNDFVAICHAVGYAHSRQIIHRDLKPSNILIGDFGEVIVVDWGLAKKLTEPKDKDVDMREVRFTDEESHTCTREGVALGTPAYMAPEQAAGQVSVTDELTDIYGLGAILFAILTGKPPHVASRPENVREGTAELLRRVCMLPTPTIRSVEPKAPPVVDAICGKAMARKRRERYQSAEELARDVQCYLADEPVSAYSESPAERAYRWFRRHRTLSLAMAAVLMIASVAGVAIATVTTNAKNRVESSLKKETEARAMAVSAFEAEQQAKESALEQFRRAQDAIDQSLSGVSEVMVVFPGTESVRSGLLQSAAEDYERLLQVDGSDPQLRREAARTRVRLADLRRSMDDYDAADEQYRRAQQEFQKLQSEFPADKTWAIDQAQVWSKLALMHMSVGESKRAEEYLQKTEEALDQSFADADLQLQAQIELAGVRLNYAILLAGDDRPEAMRLCTSAEEEFSRIVDENDDSLRAREGLAMCRRGLGQLLQITGENEQASAKLRQAELQFERLVAADEQHTSYLEGLALTRMLLGNSMRLSGDDLGPLRSYQASVDNYRTLLTLRPGMPKYRQSVATGRVNIAQMLHVAARSRDAKPHLDDAVAELISLCETYPRVSVYRESKAQCLITLAMVLRDLKQYELSETAFAGGIEEFQWLSEDFPDVLHYRGDTAIGLMGMARAKEVRGETAEARSLYNEVVSRLTRAVEQGLEPVLYRDSLALAHFYLGELLTAEEKPLAALPHFRQALRIREAMPDLPKYRRSLIRLLSECPAEEVRDPARAVTLAEELRDQVEQNPDFRYSLATAYLAAGNATQAVNEATAAVQLRSEPTPFDLFLLSIALNRSGDQEAAETSLRRAIEGMDSQCPGRIELLDLRQQAERLRDESSAK